MSILKKSKTLFTIVNPKCDQKISEKPISLEYTLVLGLGGSKVILSLRLLPPPYWMLDTFTIYYTETT